jgi:quercetin dioxygenase-like cupin family protein
MKSGTIRPETITFDGLPIDILAGRGRDPFTIMRMTVPPDRGVPSHQSPDEDKLFLVLSGSLRFHVGDEFFDVGAGESIAVAKGDTHGFVNVQKTPAFPLIVALGARGPACAGRDGRRPPHLQPEARRRAATGAARLVIARALRRDAGRG